MKFFWFWLRREWPYALVFGYLGILCDTECHFWMDDGYFLVCWTLFLVEKCPGCGLTRAGVCLVQGDFAGAWAANPLWVIVVPLGSWIVVSSVRDAKKAFRHQKNAQRTFVRVWCAATGKPLKKLRPYFRLKTTV
jgi:Protein of unknown function (DUF2752).